MENKPRGITRRIITYTILLLLLFFAVLGVIWTYGNIIEPSVVSAKHSCGILSDSDMIDIGYKTTGTFNISSGEIIIRYNEVEYSEEYYRVLRHERIHRQQLESLRLNSCDRIFLLYLDEIEAKIMERFSEETLNFIYNTNDFTLN